MKLPGAERAFIAPAKIRDYLLAADHPIGRAKARFFTTLGFTRPEWPQLQTALSELAATGEAELGERNPFGQKYVVRGILRGPTGITADIVSVWIILRGEDAPRFVTAFPGGRL
jgi:hypothetical protein